jgi:hypothetical protein
VYFADWAASGPTDPVCDVAYPVEADAGALAADADPDGAGEG